MVRLNIQQFAKKNNEEVKQPTVTQTLYTSNGAKTNTPEIKGVDKTYVDTTYTDSRSRTTA